jgi:hypothetical protein
MFDSLQLDYCTVHLHIFAATGENGSKLVSSTLGERGCRLTRRTWVLIKHRLIATQLRQFACRSHSWHVLRQRQSG